MCVPDSWNSSEFHQTPLLHISFGPLASWTVCHVLLPPTHTRVWTQLFLPNSIVTPERRLQYVLALTVLHFYKLTLLGDSVNININLSVFVFSLGKPIKWMEQKQYWHLKKMWLHPDKKSNWMVSPSNWLDFFTYSFWKKLLEGRNKILTTCRSKFSYRWHHITRGCKSRSLANRLSLELHWERYW